MLRTLSLFVALLTVLAVGARAQEEDHSGHSYADCPKYVDSSQMRSRIHRRFEDNERKLRWSVGRLRALQFCADARRKTAKTYFLGLIDRHPVGALAELRDREWRIMLGADYTDELTIRARRALDKNAKESRESTDRDSEADVQRTQDLFLKRLHAGTLTKADILESNLPPFGEGSKNQLIEMLGHSESVPRRENKSPTAP